MNKHIKRIPLYLLASVVVIFLVVWGAALIKCEVLTHRYNDAFATAHQGNPMIGDVRYFKVLSCDEESAEVYYVTDVCGHVLTFRNRNGIWTETNWRTVWSKVGSASDIVWPYWTQRFVTGF